MRRLRIPSRRQVPGIEPRKVKLVVRLDDAKSHQAGPEKIDAGSRKLWVSREDAAELLAGFPTRLRPLTSKDKSRTVGATRPRNPDHAGAFGVVAGVVVVDQKLARLRLSVFPVHQVTAVAQKRSVLE